MIINQAKGYDLKLCVDCVWCNGKNIDDDDGNGDRDDNNCYDYRDGDLIHGTV